MPTTIKEIAEACGVSKATVRRKLAELGLADCPHVTKEGQRHIVSDRAASAVASALSKQEAPPKAESAPETVEGMFERYIAVLEADKARLAAQVAEKDREIARLNESIVELASKVVEQRRPSLWDRLLPGRRP